MRRLRLLGMLTFLSGRPRLATFPARSRRGTETKRFRGLLARCDPLRSAWTGPGEGLTETGAERRPCPFYSMRNGLPSSSRLNARRRLAHARHIAGRLRLPRGIDGAIRPKANSRGAVVGETGGSTVRTYREMTDACCALLRGHLQCPTACWTIALGITILILAHASPQASRAA
jgi:hypothetical protein